MTRRHPRMCLFGVWMTTHNIKGFKNPQKGAWLGIFQPKWQNYKIVISPAENIGSIPNFDVVIEPHSWLRGWSRITKFIFKIADGRHIAEYWKRYNSFTNGRFGWNLGGRVTFQWLAVFCCGLMLDVVCCELVYLFTVILYIVQFGILVYFRRRCIWNLPVTCMSGCAG